MNGDVPSHAELWEAINQSRMDIAELKGMVSMHFRDGEHHYPPCKAAANMQKTMLSAVGAAVLALLAALLWAAAAGVTFVLLYLRGIAEDMIDERSIENGGGRRRRTRGVSR